ncbi:MAG: cob(I)yrinic acid a,c-diamide adenosyltransferase [Deltaproteobacteria bacterium]|nr:cob(I)yrinic acid a,c-diamide adenosyltransferase [Deltaproteobacteria bacterium]
MKIYTKTGDKGTSRLFTGQEVEKFSYYLHAYGDVDELNSVLGVVLCYADDADIYSDVVHLQDELFKLGADLATPIDSKKEVYRFKKSNISYLERKIDAYDTELPKLRNFILPGGHKAAAFLHLARTVCRRAEREVSKLYHEKKINPHAFVYLNRLSDYLFILARIMNHRKKVDDVIWKSN